MTTQLKDSIETCTLGFLGACGFSSGFLEEAAGVAQSLTHIGGAFVMLFTLLIIYRKWRRGA